MKVYVVRDSDFAVQGGVPASYLLHYEAYAKRYLSSFENVVLVARLFDKEDPTALPAVGPGVEFVALPGYRGPLGLVRRLPEIIRVIRRTIVRDAAYILRIPATIPTLYALVLWARGIPFAVEVAADPFDGYSPEALNHRMLAPFFRRLFVSSTRWQCKKAIASAYVTRSALQERYPPASHARSFSFTSIDLDDNAFAHSPRQPESFATQSMHIVMVGNMQKNLKGHDILIGALAALKDRGLNVTASFVGFGENRKLFEKMAADMGISDRVRFLGKLSSGAPVRAALDAADLFVLPSRQEGLPRALLEAMARGLPAVATRVGGTPELLDEELLVNPGDAPGLTSKIAELYGRQKTLAALSSRNLSTAREYHIDEIKKRRDEFFRYVRSASSQHSGHS